MDCETDNFEIEDVWQIDEIQIGVGLNYLVDATINCVRWTRPAIEDMEKETIAGYVVLCLTMTVVIDLETPSIISWKLNDIEVTERVDWPRYILDD